MTPLYKITLPESKGEVYAKMERLNPTGTHKDRSLGPWILHYKKMGRNEFVISSSGNSAVSAAKYCDEIGAVLHIFVGEKTDESKLAKIRARENVFLNISKTPMKDAVRFSKERGLINLRSSKDDLALEGYKPIAYELQKELPRVDNIFVPTSSGTTLEGIYLGFKDMGGRLPAFFAVQTAKLHPIAGYFDKDFVNEDSSYATAIVDSIAYRRDRIKKIAKETGGGGFVISNKYLEDARKVLLKTGFKAFDAGWQSILSFAGFLKREKQGQTQKGIVSVCIFTD